MVPGSEEKPLLLVGGVPLLERVVRAVLASGERDVRIATSPHTPRSAQFAQDRGWTVLPTPGEGHPQDVAFLARELTRFMTVAADLPFLPPAELRRARFAGETGPGNWVGLLPEAEASKLGLLPGDPWPRPVPPWGPCRVVGVNGVAGPTPAESVPFIFHDPWVGANVNTPEALRWSEEHAKDPRAPR